MRTEQFVHWTISPLPAFINIKNAGYASSQGCYYAEPYL